ncbi:MAG: DUF4377 domain-containing protein [Plesiomonas sp.]|uniref:DUF4377 domain-containing protein n=1 Tax=Plesiomonas sp. TaxID=2486279 RepID=UPI003F3913FD
MRTHALALLTVSALLAGCSSVSTPPNIEGNWQQADTSANIKPTTFEVKDGRMAAFAGCNRMMGMVSVENGHLIVKGMAATMMMCPPEAMQREQAFTELLNSKPAVKVAGNTLTLSNGNMQYQFIQQPSMADGVTKFIYVSADRKPCTGVAQQTCLQIRETKDAPWSNYYGTIEGFEPEPGMSYRLRIKEFDVANPAADASSKRWILDMIVETAVVKPE